MQRHKRKRKISISPLFRALAVVAAVVLITGGITFAALTSPAVKLTSNSIQTATANLQISLDGATFSNTQNGFTFANLIPGGSAVPAAGYKFGLKNSGGTPLALKMALTSAVSNPDNVDLSKVNLIIGISGGSPQNVSLAALMAATATANGGISLFPTDGIPAGAMIQYTIQASMAADAVNGPSASLGNIDLTFSGVTPTT